MPISRTQFEGMGTIKGEIVALLKENVDKAFRTEEIQKTVNSKRSTVRSALYELAKEGKTEKKPSKHNGSVIKYHIWKKK